MLRMTINFLKSGNMDRLVGVDFKAVNPYFRDIGSDLVEVERGEGVQSSI